MYVSMLFGVCVCVCGAWIFPPIVSTKNENWKSGVEVQYPISFQNGNCPRVVNHNNGSVFVCLGEMNEPYCGSA